MAHARSILLAGALTALVLVGCQSAGLPDPVDRDLDEILESDTLHVLTTYNSTSYFLYRGEAMGYEYDLLKAFADDHDLHLKVHVRSTRDSIYHRLNAGIGDVVADRVVPMAADSADVNFTEPLYETRPVLVQRNEVPADSVLPEAVDTIVEKAVDGEPERPIDELAMADTAEGKVDTSESLDLRVRLIRKPSELSGEEVTLPHRSEYFDLLVELSDTVTGDVHVVELDTTGSYESVIRYVASGAAEYTVTPRNVARLKEDAYANIQVQPVMGPVHEVAWAVRTNAPQLRDTLDAWIEQHKDTDLFEDTYRKYFVDRRAHSLRAKSRYLTGETGELSDYDGLFRTDADTLQWDWRLLASQAYQESRFDAEARSWAGAAGLLQLMPPTAREFGVANVYDPEQNVAGAARFLIWLTDYWEDKIDDDQERLKFILASYNTGHGHVEDARRLAAKHGDSTTEWVDVAYWLLQKSKREVYQDPVVKYGFARGLEPVAYVSYILDRFDHYREFVDVANEGSVTADAAVSAR